MSEQGLPQGYEGLVATSLESNVLQKIVTNFTIDFIVDIRGFFNDETF